ncbi:kinase-like domain-containing protein [Rhizophagus clarus]|uniref:Kinase-like domain-containing protein n=1 Tax=Rhizophagus clarus TaxID=94130 RepID=A0A8H3QJF2_9GLOM|nr:kinase-like domain-containing protein [Rhizophagus clarus]
MSKVEKQNKNFIYIDWIRSEIEKNSISYYDHIEFKNKKEIENNNSSVGKIFKANWNNINVAVRTSYELDVKKIVNELKVQKEVDFHINILRIYGVSKLDNKYLLVLEYADGGSLYSYLKENFTKLEWDDKYCLALQLASAIECIHNKGIVHCNLHAQNVLIHKNIIKVADFGLSQKVNEASNYSNKLLEYLPYLDPKYLNNALNIKCESIANFKSDIYSIGVLFWLLSSGRRPFCDEDTQYDVSLAMDIISGNREEIIKGTPVEYSNIYTACWSDDPDERPSIQIIVSCLKSIIDRSIKSITNEIERKPLNNDSEYVMDDYGLSAYDNFTNVMIDYDFSLNTLDYVKNNLLLNLVDLNDDVEKIVDRLIDHLIRLHDELGYIPIETEEIINHNIQDINKSLQMKISDWLIRNQTTTKYIFFHGFLYYNGIILRRDEDKAFGLFLKASKENYPIAQVYLGKCYENGNGIEKNDSKAFEYYEKAAKNENKVVQFNLGRCYGYGIGIEKDYDKSFELLEKSAKQGYIISQLCLGILYEKVKKDLDKSIHWIEKAAKKANKIAQLYLSKYYYYGTGEKDCNKLFEWCEKSAKQGCYSAIFILGHLYLEGIGTEKNLKKSLNFIEKEAKIGNEHAQFYLGRFYEDGIVVKKNLVKAFKWFEEAANNGNKHAQLVLGYYLERGKVIRPGMLQKDIKEAIGWYEKSAEQENGHAQCCLGFLYEKGEEIDQDLEKAFYWYKKAVESGYLVAHYYLGECYKNGIGIEKNDTKAFEHYKESIENGYFRGIYTLGGYYENGIGTNVDKEKAINLYKISTNYWKWGCNRKTKIDN